MFLRAALLCLAFTACLPAARAETAALNVRDFGATGDGETDDTAAFQAAFDEAARLRRTIPSAGWGESHTVPEILIPAGHYRITEPVRMQGIETRVRGVGNPVIEIAEPDRDGLVSSWSWRISISGVTFHGGRRQIALTNPNIDTGKITIRECRFRDSAQQAIELSVRSTTVVVDDCVFVQCMQALTTTTDMVTMRDCWIMSHKKMQDLAVIEARGDMLVVQDCCLVPLVGGAKQRWIDNRSTMALILRGVRFGGEGGGFTPVYNYIPASKLASGPMILIDGGWISANGSNAANCAVYCLAVPNKIEVRSCVLSGSRPILVDDSVDLATYFTGFDSRLLSFAAPDNIGLYAADLPAGLAEPLTPPEEVDESALTDAEAQALLAAAADELGDLAAQDATGLETEDHQQVCESGRYVDLLAPDVPWSLEDVMDATEVPNSRYFALRRAGTDLILMRKLPSRGTWPHVRIGPVEIDLDETPWLTLKLKEVARGGTADGYAIRVLDADTGESVMLEERYWPPLDAYRAWDLREAFGGGRRRLLVKYYYLAMGKDVAPGQPEQSEPGDYAIVDLLRFEADD